MTPAARVQAAIEVLDAWLPEKAGLDRCLLRWSRAHRFAGSGDRRAIADLAYDGVRRLRSCLFLAGDPTQVTGRDVMRGLLVLSGVSPETIFTGERFAPAPVGADEATRALTDLEAAPHAIRFDVPDWVMPHLAHLPDDVMSRMQARAPVDLRVNLRRGSWVEAAAMLAEDGIEVVAVEICPTAMRVQSAPRKVLTSKAFTSGLVEVQDASSQAAAAAACVRPGETVLDLCAGGGGKSLAFAAVMAGSGRLCAYDLSPKRLAQISDRAVRAGAQIELLTVDMLGSMTRQCDLVFVDAPCSGSGAWRRNPDAKWALAEDALTTLLQQQSALLDQAKGFLNDGGRLAYATCSFFEAENQEQVAAFCERSGFGVADEHTFHPGLAGDGFYVAVLKKRSLGA